MICRNLIIEKAAISLVALTIGLVPATFAFGEWIQRATVTASDAAEGDFFGERVDIDGSLAIVGASRNDDNGSRSGSAYLFDADPESPTFRQELLKLTASDAAENEGFGASVAVLGGVAIVGADGGIGGSAPGSTYVFDADPASPTFGDELRKLTASNAMAGARFGHAVATNGSLAIIGARDGGDCGNGISGCGAAYLFDVDPQSPSFGSELAQLSPSDPQSSGDFGYGVSLDNDRAVIGSRYGAYVFDVDPASASFAKEIIRLPPGDNTTQGAIGFGTAVNDQLAIVTNIYRNSPCSESSSCSASGAVYIYDLDPLSPTFGTQLLRLTASDGATGDNFGSSISLDDGILLVGARDDDTSAGAAYVFDLDLLSSTFGQELDKLAPTIRESSEEFGYWVGLSGGVAVVGARRNSSIEEDNGAMYIFTRQVVPEPGALILATMAIVPFTWRLYSRQSRV